MKKEEVTMRQQYFSFIRKNAKLFFLFLLFASCEADTLDSKVKKEELSTQLKVNIKIDTTLVPQNFIHEIGLH